MNDSRNKYDSSSLYRDPERGIILGVCAGVAESFKWPVWLARLGTLGLAWMFPLSVVVGYVMAALILRERPLTYCGEGDERSFWQSRRYRS